MSTVSPLEPVIGQVTTVPPPEDTPTVTADEPAVQPEVFRAAVTSLTAVTVRAEVRVEPLRPPQRLAPWSYALSAEIISPDGIDLASGRLVLLHDPDGHEAWDGVLRLVAYASAELDDQMGVDPMLPSVGWSWLTSALDERDAAYRAAGGTVTQTTSTRFGDLAGPSTTVSMEMRASWTADDTELSRHLLAFVDLLCIAAGLPPEGVTILSPG
ncbi:MAG: hypothetical protein QOF92_3825 [Pseudonocardiales bacterium]|jgi:hypothetical protein|nr:hypothetical protein [Jatrophihabitans sp.]MDT4930958.1 hypothetical protein [Pseudonocardiales bacterium]